MPRRAPKRSPEASRDEILAAARECFSVRGYHETKVDDIAECAGLSKGAIYWYFAGKRELFLALLDHEMARLLPVVAAAESAPSAEAAIHHIAEESLSELPRAFPVFELTLEYFAHAGRDPELRTRLRGMYELFYGPLVQTVSRGIREDAFAEVKPEAAARVLAATLDGLLLQKVVEPELDVPALWRTAEQLLLKGLLKR